MYDAIIRNGLIVDGTGKAAFSGDLAIKDGKIAAVGGVIGEAKEELDAAGLVVSPGFIDFHSHADMSILYDRFCSSRIYTGVTTDVIGNCGIGVAPISDDPEKAELLRAYLSTRIVGTIPAPLEFHWKSFGEYLDYIDAHAPAINIAPLLSQGAIRIQEMGFSKEDATPEQIIHMQQEVDKAMQEGALGLSSGLMYLPGAYTGTKELTELCKPMVPYGGMYVTHIRDYMDDLFPSVEEAIEIAENAGVPLHLSHFQIMTSKNSGKVQEILDVIEDARKRGVEVSLDTMPYDAGMTSLSALLPPWSMEGGVQEFLKRIEKEDVREKIIKDTLEGTPTWRSSYLAANDWEKVTIATVQTEKNRWAEGKTIAQAAREMGMDIFPAIFKLLEEEDARIQICIVMKDYADVEKFVVTKDMMIGSDSMTLSTEGLLSKGKPHPRAFGTFGKYFHEFVQEKRMLHLEEAVHKVTQVPARRLGFLDRGVLQVGAHADVTVFDAQNFRDLATYTDPKQYSVGVQHVLVNGQIALRDGKQTDVCAGKVWRNTRKK